MKKNKNQHRVQDILKLIRTERDPYFLERALDSYHDHDIADVFPLLSSPEWKRLASLLPAPYLADLMEYVDDKESLFEVLPAERAAAILTQMEPDEAVDFLKETQSAQKEAWVAHLDEATRQKLTRLAAYDEDTIASRMTTNFVAVEEGLDVPSVMRTVVREAADHDEIAVIYALNDRAQFAGAFSLKDLIIARRDTPLNEIIVRGYPYVYASEKISDCLQLIEEYSEASIPVLSPDHRILGVVTANDVAQLLDDEMGEDYAKLGGLSAEEDLDEPLKTSIKKRLPWLILLLGLGLVVSSVVSLYENVVAKLTLIMAFQSMILDMSGNVGTQSLAVTIRVLMDEELKPGDKWRLIRKEGGAGFFNGLILGCIAVLGIGFYIYAVKSYDALTAFGISSCIGLSLVLAMFISSLVGTVVPMGFKKIHIDPAVASGPLITTVTDLVGVVTYYTLAWAMLVHGLGL